jgi:cbb3-type cytochrome oxidase subunit 3
MREVFALTAPENIRQEGVKLLLIIFFIGVFIGAAYHSWRELRFRLEGETSPGKIYRQGPAERMHSNKTLFYEFEDHKGKKYKGRIEVNKQDIPEILKKGIKVVYAKSNPEVNTLQSQRTILWLFVLIGMLSVIIGFIIWLFLKASKETRKQEENLLL